MKQQKVFILLVEFESGYQKAWLSYRAHMKKGRKERAASALVRCQKTRALANALAEYLGVQARLIS